MMRLPRSPDAEDVWPPQERRTYLRLFPLALLVTVVIELLNHRSFTEGPAGFARFVGEAPLAFLTNVLIVAVTLSPALLLRRRLFWCMLVSLVWLVCGGVNGFILANRGMPFTMADLTVFETGIDTVPNYLSSGHIVVLGAALSGVMLAMAVLFWKGPRSDRPQRARRLSGASAVALSSVLMGLCCAAGFWVGDLSSQFANLAYAYEDYGFSYCFLQTWFNRGIRRPDRYSAAAVERLCRAIEERTAALGARPQTDVNVIFLQMESFLDPAQIQGLTLSEDPVPNWTALKERFSSGYLMVPVVGAGTANTEFEVLTGVSTLLFGPGEYPYQTCLTGRTAESLAYDLRENGYAAHAIHNHRAAFYSRDQVYANLGFDDFTSLEYMPPVETTPTGWAEDSVLTGQILQALDVTADQPDFVFAVTVQGHGKYPEEQVLKDPAVRVRACPGAGSRWAMEYYVNQLRQTDEFLGELVDALSRREERVLLVAYGDHVPALDLDGADLASGSLYCTEYLIWDNFGLEPQDKSLAAYQLAAEALGRLGITTGMINSFHQTFQAEPDYWKQLRLLGYDALYGVGCQYGSHGAPEPADMQMGMVPIEITGMEPAGGDWLILGENFTPYCVVTEDGELRETAYETSWLLRVKGPLHTRDYRQLEISVVDRDDDVLGSSG